MYGQANHVMGQYELVGNAVIIQKTSIVINYYYTNIMDVNIVNYNIE